MKFLLRISTDLTTKADKTRRRFLPNLHTVRFWLENEKRFIKLKVSRQGLRIIDKKGIDKVVAELRARGEHI